MLKKIVITVLILCTLVSLVGCSKGSTDTTNGNTTTSTNPRDSQGVGLLPTKTKIENAF